VQSIVRYKRAATDTETEQEATTRGVWTASERNVRKTASSRRSRRRKTRSAKPVDRRSNTGHTDVWRLQALRVR